MQEIKTLTTREITTPTQVAEFDSEINALLADGWTILTSGISTTTGPVHTYCSVMLVRETEPAPVETPLQGGTTVKITDVNSIFYDKEGVVVWSEKVAGEETDYRIKINGSNDYGWAIARHLKILSQPVRWWESAHQLNELEERTGQTLAEFLKEVGTGVKLSDYDSVEEMLASIEGA